MALQEGRGWERLQSGSSRPLPPPLQPLGDATCQVNAPTCKRLYNISQDKPKSSKGKTHHFQYWGCLPWKDCHSFNHCTASPPMSKLLWRFPWPHSYLWMQNERFIDSGWKSCHRGTKHTRKRETEEAKGRQENRRKSLAINAFKR